MQFATRNLQHAICNTICNMQFATCYLQHAIYNMQFTTCNDAISSVSVLSFSGSLEGGRPSSAEVIEDTEDFLYHSGLYSLFVEPTDLLYMFHRFLYLIFRDFFNQCLRDFFNQSVKVFL